MTPKYLSVHPLPRKHEFSRKKQHENLKEEEDSIAYLFTFFRMKQTLTFIFSKGSGISVLLKFALPTVQLSGAVGTKYRFGGSQ